MIIYKATNKISKNCYVGKTEKTLEKRKEQHFNKARRPKSIFHKALNSYGKENFEWKIVHKANPNENLNELEKKYIKEYNSFEDGYNMTEGGDGGYNEEVVKANRKKRKGKTYMEIYGSKKLVDKIKSIQSKNVKEHNKKYGFDVIDEELQLKYAKMGAKALQESGYTHSEETKKKIGDAQRGITFEERYDKEEADRLRKKISERTKEAMKNLDWDDWKKKTEKGKRKYWNNKHKEDRKKIIEMKNDGYKVKEIIAELGVSAPTYYKRWNEIKDNT